MAPVSFSVSEVRVAASCPRILYFDSEHTRRNRLKAKSVTRIWKEGDAATTACGSLFHNAVERFNRAAATAPEVRSTLEGGSDRDEIDRGLLRYFNLHCIDRNALAAKGAAPAQAFIKALRIYMGELADIVAYALARGKPASEIIDQMFGDRRRRVDVTFQVGPVGEPVHVTGILDYVFYDWRTANHRILDYKLTPATEPTNDLFQVSLYALMHNLQHRTQPNVGVLYLHPQRSIFELTWEEVYGRRHLVYDLLASMADWVRYDEARREGLKPPGVPSYCQLCKWDKDDQCVRRLGPKHEGLRHRHWSDAMTAGSPPTEPRVEVREDGGSPGLPPAQVVVRVVTAPSPRPRRDASGGPDAVPEESPPAGTPPAPGDDALRIGTTSEGGQAVGLPLTALPTHVAVVGAAGSGKTWMAKVLAEEAIRLGVPVLAVDPQGDLVQFLRPSDRTDGLSAADEGLRRAFLDRVEPRIWTPGSSHGRRLSLDPIRLAGRDELARIDPTRREEEWEGMLAVAASQLVGLARMGGEEDSQQTFLLQVLRSLARDGGGAMDLGRVTGAITDPGIVGLDNPDQFIKKSDREKLARKLNGLRVGPSANLYTGGQRLDLDALRRADEPGKTPLNVVYLNALADDAQKQFFVGCLAAEVYRWMVTSLEAAPGRVNLLFYIDEARDFIPAGTAKPPAKTPLIRLFTQGRKYGVACLLCTQSPRSVDYNVFGNCSTKLVGRLESAQDVDRVAEWFGKEGQSPAWLPGRKGAAAGSFVGRWPGMPASLEGRAFRSRPLFSLHEGAWSPDRLEREMAAQPARNAPNAGTSA